MIRLLDVFGSTFDDWADDIDWIVCLLIKYLNLISTTFDIALFDFYFFGNLCFGYARSDSTCQTFKSTRFFFVSKFKKHPNLATCYRIAQNAHLCHILANEEIFSWQQISNMSMNSTRRACLRAGWTFVANVQTLVLRATHAPPRRTEFTLSHSFVFTKHGATYRSIVRSSV